MFPVLLFFMLCLALGYTKRAIAEDCGAQYHLLDALGWALGTFVHARECLHDRLCLALGTPLWNRCAWRFQESDVCMEAATRGDDTYDAPLYCERHGDMIHAFRVFPPHPRRPTPFFYEER